MLSLEKLKFDDFVMKFKLIVLRLIGIKNVAYMMIPIRDYWIFIDPYGKIWKIKPTGRYDYPLEISLVER